MGRKNSNARKVRKSISHPKGSGYQIITKLKHIEVVDKYKDEIDNMFKEDMKKNRDFHVICLKSTEKVKEVEKGISELNDLVNINSETDRLPIGFFTENDEELYYINNAKKIITDFMTLLDSLDTKFSYANTKYQEADRKKIDIEHNIELEYENCYQTWIIARAFKHVLMERRDYKNIINRINILKELKIENNIKKIIQRAIDKLNNEEELRKNRIYCPRSSLNLPINRTFYNLSEDKQKELKYNLEIGRRRA